MALITVTVFLTFCLLVGVESASVSLSSNQLTLNGNARIQFYGPREEIWNGLSDGHRYPLILSGDRIALRLAYTSGTLGVSWILCNDICQNYTCPGKVMTSLHWSSCAGTMQFKITAMGKMDGQPINSGDSVSLSSIYYGTDRRLYCGSSSSTKCYVLSTTSSMVGNNWLVYSNVSFLIYSRNAVDGTPVQFGDIMGLKYPYAGRSAWLYYSDGFFYAKSCSDHDKTSCAKENYPAGFRIFKKL